MSASPSTSWQHRLSTPIKAEASLLVSTVNMPALAFPLCSLWRKCLGVRRTQCWHKSLGLLHRTLVSPLCPCVYPVIYINMDTQTFVLCIALEISVTLCCCLSYLSLATGGSFGGQQIPLVISSLEGLNTWPFQTVTDAASFGITPVQPRKSDPCS